MLMSRHADYCCRLRRCFYARHVTRALRGDAARHARCAYARRVRVMRREIDIRARQIAAALRFATPLRDAATLAAATYVTLRVDAATPAIFTTPR